MTSRRTRIIVIATSFALGLTLNATGTWEQIVEIKNAALYDIMIEMGLYNRCMLEPGEIGMHREIAR